MWIPLFKGKASLIYKSGQAAAKRKQQSSERNRGKERHRERDRERWDKGTGK